MKSAELMVFPLLFGGSSMIYRIPLLQIILCLFVALSPVWSLAEPDEAVESEALEIFKGMNDYQLSQQLISSKAFENEEIVLDDGLHFQDIIKEIYDDINQR